VFSAAIAALNTGDYETAWREFAGPAERGDAEAQAGAGAMLFERLNPPGTGTYADCEGWLTKSAAQGSVKGMSYLGRFYYAEGTRLMGDAGAGPTWATRVPAVRQAAALRLMQAREWFERAAARGDTASMTRLAAMLETGAGGTRDAARAARLRSEALRGARDARTSAVAASPARAAIVAAWQAGRHLAAIEAARPLADAGDPTAQALLGRAYYEGVGVPRDHNWALAWLQKAAEQGSADGMFFLGLMYEHGRGVRQDLPRALDLLDRAAALGQPDALNEAAGMRAQPGTIRPNADTEGNACRRAGGTPFVGACVKAGTNVDPYDGPR